MMRAIFAPGAQNPMALPKENCPSLGVLPKVERIDWEAFQSYFMREGFITDTTESPTRDALRAMEHYAPYFEQWSEWRIRPRCQFDIDRAAAIDVTLPHLKMFEDTAALFALQSRAHLDLGDSPAAYADFREGFQAYRALAQEPAVLSGLVKISVLSHLTTAVGEGLYDRRWRDAELQQIEADLSTVRIWEDMTLAYSSERAFSNCFHEAIISSSIQRRRTLLNQAFEPAKFSAEHFVFLIPRRVYRADQLQVDRYFEEMLARVSADGGQFDPDGPMPSGAEPLSGEDAPYFLLLRLIQYYYKNFDAKFVLTRTRIDQARIAIALERFRIARSAFPESLAELVPDFVPALPLDTYTRRPFIYRRNESGGFFMYSVGQNRSDDDGATDTKLFDERQADWVWPF